MPAWAGTAMLSSGTHSRPGCHPSRMASKPRCCSPRLPQPLARTSGGEDLTGSTWINPGDRGAFLTLLGIAWGSYVMVAHQRLPPNQAPLSPHPAQHPSGDTSTEWDSPAASHTITAQGTSSFCLEATDSPCPFKSP